MLTCSERTVCISGKTPDVCLVDATWVEPAYCEYVVAPRRESLGTTNWSLTDALLRSGGISKGGKLLLDLYWGSRLGSVSLMVCMRLHADNPVKLTATMKHVASVRLFTTLIGALPCVSVDRFSRGRVHGFANLVMKPLRERRQRQTDTGTDKPHLL